MAKQHLDSLRENFEIWRKTAYFCMSSLVMGERAGYLVEGGEMHKGMVIAQEWVGLVALCSKLND